MTSDPLIPTPVLADDGTAGPLSIGDAGTAAAVEGAPAMLAVPQPDAMIDAGVFGPLTIRAASVRGAGHRYDGTPRQDDFCIGVGGPDNGVLVAVVADGVSAGPSSHLASRAAVRFGVKLLGDRLAEAPPAQLDWDEIVGSVAGFVLAQARNQAGDPQLEPRDAARLMATTIAFAVIPVLPDGDGTRTCTAVPVGDTSVWVLRGGERWESVTAIKNDGAAVASSATVALPLLPAAPVVPLSTTLELGDSLFVMTDGVGDPLGDGTGQVGGALARAWARPPDRYQFASQVDFRRRSHTDDRTVVAVWPDVVPTDPALVADASAVAPVSVVTDVTTTESTTDPVAGPELGSAAAGEPDGPWQPTPWEPTPWTPG